MSMLEKLALLAVAECEVTRGVAYTEIRAPHGTGLTFRSLERRGLIRRFGDAYVLTDAGFGKAAAIVEALPV